LGATIGNQIKNAVISIFSANDAATETDAGNGSANGITTTSNTDGTMYTYTAFDQTNYAEINSSGILLATEQITGSTSSNTWYFDSAGAVDYQLVNTADAGSQSPLTGDTGSSSSIISTDGTLSIYLGEQGVTFQGTNDVLNDFGTYDTATLSAGATANEYGTDNTAVLSNGTIFMNSGTELVIVTGSLDTLYSSGTADVVGMSDGTAFLTGASAALTVDGSNVTVNGYAGGGGAVGFAGTADTANLSDGGIYLESETSVVTVTGSLDTAYSSGTGNVLGMSDGTADLGSSSAGLTVDGSNVTVNGYAGGGGAVGFAGTADTANLSDGGIYLESETAVVTVTGSLDIAYSSGTDDWLGMSDGTADLGSSSAGLTVDGSNVTVNGYAGGGGAVGFSGTGELLGMSDGAAFLESASTAVTTDGSNLTVYGYGGGGGGGTVGFSGTGELLSMSDGAAYLQSASTSLTADGSNLTVYGYGGSGGGGTVGFSGTGQTANMSDGTIVLNPGTDSVTIVGTSDIAYSSGTADALTMPDGGTAYLFSSSASLTVTGSGVTVDSYEDGTGTVGFTGTGTVNMSDGLIVLNAGTGADTNNVTVNGANTTVYSSGTNDLLTMSDGTADLFSSSSALTLYGSDVTVNSYDGGAGVVGFTGTGDVANMSSGSIVLQSDSSATDVGNSDTIYLDQNSTVVVSGTNDLDSFDGGGSFTMPTRVSSYYTVTANTIDTLSNASVYLIDGDSQVQYYTPGSSGPDTTDNYNPSGIIYQGISLDSGDYIGDSYDPNAAINEEIDYYNPDSLITSSNIDMANGDSVFDTSSSPGTYTDGTEVVISSGDTLYDGSYGGYDSGFGMIDSEYSFGGYEFDTGNSDDLGSYDDGGFSGDLVQVSPGQASGINAIGQTDLAQSQDAAVLNIEAAFQQADTSASGAPAASGSPPAPDAAGAAWGSRTITWAFAAGPSAGPDAFSGAIAAQFQPVIEQALQAWTTASGLTFQEVTSPASADIQIGWGTFDTPATNITGYTNLQQSGGLIQPGVIVRLEDPGETALATGSDGQPTYTVNGATLYQVALQQIGHALGLGESSDPDSVMSSELGPANTALNAADTADVSALYGTSSAQELGAAASQSAAATPADGDIITITDSNMVIDPGIGNHVIQIVAGATSDTVVLHAGASDQIVGFDPSEGDMLDLRSLLSEAHVALSADLLGSYVTVASSGGAAQVFFDPTGHGGGSVVASLYNPDWTAPQFLTTNDLIT
jgi:hypothetical protein